MTFSREDYFRYKSLNKAGALSIASQLRKKIVADVSRVVFLNLEKY